MNIIKFNSKPRKFNQKLENIYHAKRKKENWYSRESEATYKTLNASSKPGHFLSRNYTHSYNKKENLYFNEIKVD
jgi:hypothetical protein